LFVCLFFDGYLFLYVGVNPASITASQLEKKQRELENEILDVKKRREQRELEKIEMERMREMQQKEAELEQMQGWEEKEEQFHR
jgi:Tfp pilus assembly protein PilN